MVQFICTYFVRARTANNMNMIRFYYTVTENSSICIVKFKHYSRPHTIFIVQANRIFNYVNQLNISFWTGFFDSRLVSVVSWFEMRAAR